MEANKLKTKKVFITTATAKSSFNLTKYSLEYFLLRLYFIFYFANTQYHLWTKYVNLQLPLQNQNCIERTPFLLVTLDTADKLTEINQQMGNKVSIAKCTN